jgi:hypothetical protein
VVQLPFLTYHYLHYLTVPHPAESAYRAGMANDLPIPDLASSVADVMYRYDHLDYAALPPNTERLTGFFPGSLDGRLVTDYMSSL